MGYSGDSGGIRTELGTDVVSQAGKGTSATQAWEGGVLEPVHGFGFMEGLLKWRKWE